MPQGACSPNGTTIYLPGEQFIIINSTTPSGVRYYSLPGGDTGPDPAARRITKVVRLPQIPSLDQCPRCGNHGRPEIPGRVCFSPCQCRSGNQQPDRAMRGDSE